MRTLKRNALGPQLSLSVSCHSNAVGKCAIPELNGEVT
jgi:hypothetical protein